MVRFDLKTLLQVQILSHQEWLQDTHEWSPRRMENAKESRSLQVFLWEKDYGQASL